MPEQPSEKSIFLAALEIGSATERVAFLDSACAGNQVLRAEIDALLQAHETPQRLLDNPVESTTIDEPTLTAYPGVVIGAYKLVEEIGEGGMGSVWMAQQTEPVKRLVAVKLIKPGMDSKQVLARFEAERQALALMDHPNIARVLDAGTTATGRPYFVMELVKGVAITRYCDEHRLTPRQRLELFIPICQAIQHAHQKGIIHRDIKPSNVLVCLYDGKAVPKVIDFGIAKATGQQLTEQTLITGFGNIVGTLEYMSPEQAELNQLDIDTRSDIYSLGVLLYELLTGTTPLEKKRLKAAAMLEVLRLIREEEPPRPSTRLSESKDTLPSVSAQRQMEAAKLAKLVRGELDWIVMKALEKDRNRRYETANGLMHDIQRYLADEPVQACPPSAWYRLRKFARRNKTALAVAGLLLFFIALLGGGGGWVLRDRAAREQEARDREAALDREVARLLEEAGKLTEQGKWPEALAVVEQADKLLASAGRSERPERLLLLQKELNMAQRLEDIRRERAQPHAMAPGLHRPGLHHGGEAVYREQHAQFARAFQELGIDIDALEPAEAVARMDRTSIREALVRALDDWAMMRWAAGHKFLHFGDEWALDGLKTTHGKDGRVVTTAVGFDPGWKKLVEIAQQADRDEWRNGVRGTWLSHDRQALEKLADAIPRRDMPPATLHLLGASLSLLNAQGKAMSVLRQAQRQYPDDLWINHTLAQWSQTGRRPEDFFGYYYSIGGGPRMVAPRGLEFLGLAAQTVGSLGTPNLASAMRQLLAVKQLHDWSAEEGPLRSAEDAVRFFTAALALRPRSLQLHLGLAGALYEKGEVDEAMAEFSRAIELAPKDPDLWHRRGVAYRSAKRYKNAIEDFSKAIELSPKWYFLYVELSEVLRADGQLNRAITVLRKAVEIVPNVERQRHHHRLANALSDKGLLDEAIDEFRKGLNGKDEPFLHDAHHDFGVALGRRGKLEEAIEEFRKALRVREKVGDWLSREKEALFRRNLAYALAAKGRLDEAIAEFRTALQIQKDDPLAHHDLGLAHHDLGLALEAKGQLKEAIAEYDRVVGWDPKNADAHFRLGNALRRNGELDRAVAAYSRALELDPKFVNALCGRGIVYCDHLGQPEKAVSDYSRAIELDPKFVDAWFNRSISRSNLGQYDKAIADCSKAIELDPRHAGAHNNLAWLLATCPDAKLRDPKRAVELARKAVEIAPKEGGYWNTLGVAHYRAGDCKAAILAIHTSIEKSKGGDACDWFILAMSHWKLGEPAEAHKQYDQAVQWMKENEVTLAKKKDQAEELRRFRSEAEEVLQLKK
jgi:tetratricopeptide (TPR) repeat protein